MAKLVGIVLLVLGVWVGITLYTEGTHRAFGGVLARFAPAPAEGALPDTRAPLERVRDKVRAAREASSERIERGLDADSPEGR